MRAFADAGYDVRVLLADAPVETELERNEARAFETGLRYDAETVRRLSIQVAQRFTDWSTESWIGSHGYSTAD